MELMALSIEQNRLRLVAITGAGIELRGAVPILGYENYSHDVAPSFISHLELSQWGSFIELTHGTDWSQSTAIHRSSDGGRTLARVEPPLSAGPVHTFTSSPDGTLLGIADWRHSRHADAVWVRLGAGPWKSLSLPVGFLAEGVSRSRDGTIYVAGGRPPDSRSEAASAQEALLVLRGSEMQIIEPCLTPDVRSKIRANWKSAERLLGVDAAGEPLAVLTAWRDSEDACVLIANEPHWHALEQRLSQPRVFRDRPGAVTVYDGFHGRRFRTPDRGQTWAVDALMPAVQKALKAEKTALEHVTLVDMDVRGDMIALIARGANSSGDVVLMSNDDGKTFGILVPPGERLYQRVSLPY